MGVLDTLRRVVDNPQQIIKDWKAEGKKVVGFTCLYVPEEIIHAAGMLPWPTFGTPEPITKADSYFQPNSCEYVRNLFDLGIDQKMDFLDSLILCNTCDAVRHLKGMWSKYINSVPCHMINNPQKMYDESGFKFYRHELEEFKETMEDLSGSKITKESLQQSIALFDETRALLKEINNLRKKNIPSITGAEALTVAMAAMLMPKEKANPLLKQLLDEIKNREIDNGDGPRILLTGSLIDNPVHIELIQDMGGVVVADDLCSSKQDGQSLAKVVVATMDAIVRFKLERSACACMHPSEERYNYLKDLAEEFRADGIIYFILKYCHSCMLESTAYKKRLEEDIPTLSLEIDHSLSGLGQLKTRVQAFIEML